MMEAVREILPFLELSARLDLKTVALDTVQGLTGSAEGLEILSGIPEIVDLLLDLTEDKCNVVAKDAALSLINFSADRSCATKFLSQRATERVSKLWKRIEYDMSEGPADEKKSDSTADPTKADPSIVVDPCCMILSNLTIDSENCETVWTCLTQAGVKINTVVDLLCLRRPAGPYRHYLATALSNLTQFRAVRESLLNRSEPLLQTILIFTEHDNIKRRGGIIGTIRNCCFDTGNHEWLLETVDILPRLLLPLAGPTPEDLDDEEIDKLPIDLQYLDESKKVEEDPDIRKLLLEALLQLCATRKCREILRSKNAYYVLRELHKNEEDKVVRLACENVVDILIKKEEEINIENYHEHEVPEDIVPQLVAMDDDYLKD